MSEQLLVEQCKNNSQRAQMQLYKQYSNGMFIIANRYMKDTAAAEDAMQEGFIKAFKKIDQFSGQVTFGAWLKRIVINTCLDAIKAKKMQMVQLNEEVGYIADEEDDWEIAESTTVDEVKNAINALPEKYKVVIKMYLLEGYDHQEIGEIMNMSENTSRTILHRGRIQLKETLKHLRYGTGS